MENLTPGQVVAIMIGVLVAVAGFVNTVGNAAEKIVRAWRAAKAPEEAQNDRLLKVERDVEDIKRKLKNDADALADNSKANHVTQEALLALLEHGLHGNNVDQMTTAKKNLEKYLINH